MSSVIYVCGNCGSDVGEDEACPCYGEIDLSGPAFITRPDFTDLEFISLCGNCGVETINGRTRCVCCLLDAALAKERVTNTDLGFGPGDDDEQENLNWFLATGRIIA